jgi:biotin carboxylase
MQERIIILGAGVMQGPAIKIAKELGLYTIVVDGSSSALHKDMADQFEQIDLKDKEGIEAFARSLQNSGGLGGIMTAGTDFSATVAWVAEKLNLPGIPYEAALNASDKSLMRACFKKAGLPSPEYVVITKEWGVGGPTDLSVKAAFTWPTPFCINSSTCSPVRMPSLGGSGEHSSNNDTTFDLNSDNPNNISNSSFLIPHSSFPLVIKPVDNMGGRGCRRVDSMGEFDAAAAEALRFSRSGRAIVEAYMDGPEFSVDAIVYHGEITICGLADRHIFFPPYFIEMGHTMPTVIAPEQQTMLLETFCAGVRALGLADGESIGAAKGDIKLTAQGPMIGEIAARLSGGYMSGWTYPYSSGVEPIRAAILAAMGRKPDCLNPVKSWTSAERAFISIPGTVKAITGTAHNNPLVKDLFLRIAKGDKVNFPENNVSKCGNIISAAPERAVVIEAAESAAKAILIRLDPEDQKTAEFLSLNSSFLIPHSSLSPNFPPDAYQLDHELSAALLELPETNLADTNTPSLYSPLIIPNSSFLISNSSFLIPHSLSLLSFPEFETSGLKDYVGRNVTDSLAAVRQLTGLPLPEIQRENIESTDNKYSFLGKSFWAALVRGGYQGAVYYIDRLRGEN